MEILQHPSIGFSPAKLKENLDDGRMVKFVMIQVTERVAEVFGDLTHSSEANMLLRKYGEATFLGAGVLTKKLDIVWNSDSCRNEFGHDIPKENAEQIAAEFKAALLRFIG